MKAPLARGLRAALLLVTVFCGSTLLGCAEAKDEPSDTVVATVDGLPLTEHDVLRTYADVLIATGQNDTEALRRRHVDSMVDAYLLGAEAERRGLGASEGARTSALLARRQLLGARYYETAVIDTLSPPSDAELRQAYARSQEQRVVRQLYFRREADARAAHARLEAGSPFVEEAQALYETDDPAAGQLGTVRYWQLDDAFAEAAFSTPVGRHSAPVRSRFGWHIVLVEDRIRNPLLSEDEFVRRRGGIDGKLRQRRSRVEGDRFVRTFMEARQVALNRSAIETLDRVVAAFEEDPLPDARQPDARQQAPRPLSAQERAEVATALAPDTELASFTLADQRQSFTVSDYLFWLSVLPPSEIRTRTGASVGRALRNEVFALAAEAEGLDEDPAVRHELARKERLRLAGALRRELRQAPPSPADTARLVRVASELGLQSQRVEVDFWAVPFATRAEAEAALVAIEATPGHASRLPGYRAAEGVALEDARDLAAALRSAPLGQPVLASAGNGRWAVLRVADRRSVAGPSGVETLAPLAAEAALVERLRDERPIALDSDALDRVTSPPAVPSARR